MSIQKAITIVIPIYNDWQSFSILLKQISSVASDLQRKVSIVAVDDGSHSTTHISISGLSTFIKQVKVIHLIRNLGHQRAIAIGLVSLLGREDIESIIIMDADGEDNPEDIKKLLQIHDEHPDNVIVARRKSRREGFAFQLYYEIYKLLFLLMAGVDIDFGNFCLIPYSRLETLTYNPNLWNHLAATIKRTSVQPIKLNIDRNKRIAGQSKMNFQSLVLHGLSAISVYNDVIAVRALLLFSFTGLAAIVGIVIVLCILVFTDLAIPGWATSAVGLLVIIVFQNILLLAGAVFSILSQRSRILITPALDTLHLIKKEEVLVG